ncbi:MAG: hypothetical protein O3C40_08100 [Planctomycetota bacterium]|nr:hypothetical protein [Planctomycetota bacterium]
MFNTSLLSLLKTRSRRDRRRRSRRSRVLVIESLTERIALDAAAVAQLSDAVDRSPELISQPREDVNDDG